MGWGGDSCGEWRPAKGGQCDASRAGVVRVTPSVTRQEASGLSDITYPRRQAQPLPVSVSPTPLGPFTSPPKPFLMWESRQRKQLWFPRSVSEQLLRLLSRIFGNQRKTQRTCFSSYMFKNHYIFPTTLVLHTIFFLQVFILSKLSHPHLQFSVNTSAGCALC